MKYQNKNMEYLQLFMHIIHSELLHYLLKLWQYPVVQHVPKSKGLHRGATEPDSIRESMLSCRVFFSSFASCCICYLAIGPYVASLLHWLWKWGQQKKKTGPAEAGLGENEWTNIGSDEEQTKQSGGITWGRAWITVSNRARIPTAIFKSFNTKKK